MTSGQNNQGDYLMYEPQQKMANFNHLASGIILEDGRQLASNGSSIATV
jgi:hypothetical protein